MKFVDFKIFTVTIMLLLCILVACSNTAISIPNEKIIDIIQKAEAIYQPGNEEVLSIGEYEVQFSEAGNIVYYDEISNYNDAISGVLTESAIDVLESSNILGIPIIVKRDEKIYRVSAMSDSMASLFFRTIRSIELIEQHDNQYIYKVVHVNEPRRPEYNSIDEAPSMESIITIVENNGEYLINEFPYPLLTH